MADTKKYQIIYADPPWEYPKWAWKDKAIKPLNDFYPTMSIEEIKRLQVPAEDNSWLILWTTVPKLQEGLDTVKAWGFDYRTSGVWDKGNGLGFFFRVYHEILIVGKRGNPKKPSHSVPSVFREPRRKHSQKPECVRKWIEDCFPGTTKLEMFCRDKREGWDTWGNEVPNDIELQEYMSTKQTIQVFEDTWADVIVQGTDEEFAERLKRLEEAWQ